MTRLSLSTLRKLPEAVERPRYDPPSVRPGLVHLGVGNFHRAHQAVATDDALNAGQTDWGIIGLSLRRPDLRDALVDQDWLYSLTIRDGDLDRRRVVGALRNMLVVPEDPGSALAFLSDPSTKVVTLTVTEKGYYAASGTGELLQDDPAIQDDLAPGSVPRTTIGLLAEGLAARYQAGRAPVTLLSCDNLAHNGAILRRALADFLTEKHPDTLPWLEEAVAFPSSMVDRIVPATTPDLIGETTRQIGFEDAAPVETEPFLQWVIEDRFAAGHPDWAGSGAEFVPDVGPFEAMKLRLLNGAHTLLAAAGRLAGYDTVSDAMADPSMAGLVQRLWQESARTLPAELDTSDYTRRLTARFGNTALRHRLAQIAADGSQKLPQRLLAPLREARAADLPHRILTFAVAAWIRANGGRDDNGGLLTIDDPQLGQWQDRPDQTRAPAEAVIRRWLDHSPVFGRDLSRDAGFVTELTACYDGIRRLGVRRATLAVEKQVG